MKSLYAFVFDQRNTLAGGPLLYMLISTRWEWDEDRLIWPIAILLCVAGGLLRGWARCHCNFARRKKKVLATTGPYAFSRNPLYIGNLLIIAGAGVASELAWFLPILVLWGFAVYTVVIKHEEGRLLEKYGDEYLDYRSRVGAWLSIPQAIDFSAPGFLRVAAFQVLIALLFLVPFAVKDLNPFSFAVWA